MAARDWRKLLEVVAEGAGYPNFATFKEKSGRRSQMAVMWWQLGMLCCRVGWGMSYPEIGELFGMADHSTVLHNVSQAQKKLRTQAPHWRRSMRELVQTIEVKEVRTILLKELNPMEKVSSLWVVTRRVFTGLSETREPVFQGRDLEELMLQMKRNGVLYWTVWVDAEHAPGEVRFTGSDQAGTNHYMIRKENL